MTSQQILNAAFGAMFSIIMAMGAYMVTAYDKALDGVEARMNARMAGAEMRTDTEAARTDRTNQRINTISERLAVAESRIEDLRMGRTP